MAVVFVMNLVFITLGSLGSLPFAAQVTAVALGGVAIAVTLVFNVIGDVSICRRMFGAPGGYLHALTPAPRRQILLASVITMAVMDLVSLAVAVIGEVILLVRLAGENIGGIIWDTIRDNASVLWPALWYIALLAAGYLLLMMIILFCATMRRSIFYQKPAGGLLTILLAAGTVYAVNCSALLLAPFGVVTRYGAYFSVALGGAGMPAYALLILIEAAALFVLTSRLMERKMNI